MLKTSETLTFPKKTVAKWLFGLVLLLIVSFVWLWWHFDYQNPTHVFWSMINNNLSLASITKYDSQSQQGILSKQYTLIQFGALDASHTVSTVSQTGDLVSSETIGTASNDYSRYRSIKATQKSAAGKAAKASKIVGIWGKTPNASSSQPASAQYFQQSILGVVPFGNFNESQRSELIKQIRSSNLYSLSQTKTVKVNGRAAFVYEVSVNPEALVNVLVLYAKDIGLGNVGLDPTQYIGSPAIKTEFTVDKLSDQLIKVRYPSNNQSEVYYSQGLEQPIMIPAKTVPISELQHMITQSLK
jgi:hypothetical protein